jgi:hypothetical protein
LTWNVDSTQGWQQTGISVRPGDSVTIEVVGGTWSEQPGQTSANPGTGWSYVCTDYLSASRCLEPIPDFWKGALIGRVGGSLFGIGNKATITAAESGVLFLRINDEDVALTDNAGTLTVKITVVS